MVLELAVIIAFGLDSFVCKPVKKSNTPQLSRRLQMHVNSTSMGKQNSLYKSGNAEAEDAKTAETQSLKAVLPIS
jgi:hypothetical protein